MLRTSFCDYSNAYVLVKGTITVVYTGTAAALNNVCKKKIFKNCTPFTSCISTINNTQINDDEYIDIVVPINNLIKYSANHSKTFGILWQFCKDVPAVDANSAMTNFTDANATTDSFSLKEKLRGQIMVQQMLK